MAGAARGAQIEFYSLLLALRILSRVAAVQRSSRKKTGVEWRARCATRDELSL
jgi:hypothetical protein